MILPSLMITDIETIVEKLSTAKSIFCLEGYDRIPLEYKDGVLYRDKPFGRKVMKQIAEVERIIFDDATMSWFVVWFV